MEMNQLQKQQTQRSITFKANGDDAFSFNSEQDQEYLKEALEDVKEHQDHIADLIAGRAEPERCGHCEYCRGTKQITAFTSAADIEVE